MMKKNQDDRKKNNKQKHLHYHHKKPQIKQRSSRIMAPDQFMRYQSSSLHDKYFDQQEYLSYVEELFAENNQHKFKEIKIDPSSISNSQTLINHLSQNDNGNFKQLRELLNRIKNDIKRISRNMKNSKKREIHTQRRNNNRRHRNGWDSLQKPSRDEDQIISQKSEQDCSEDGSSSEINDGSISEESGSYSSESDRGNSKGKRQLPTSSRDLPFNERYQRNNYIRKSVEKYDFFAQPDEDY